MHKMDATHLLTIGYDASDQGSFAWFTGVALQTMQWFLVAGSALAVVVAVLILFATAQPAGAEP